MEEYSLSNTTLVTKEYFEELKRKEKAFDTFLKYKEHVEKYDNSDCHELQNVFNFVMKEYEGDE